MSTTPEPRSREERRDELMELDKRELAEMLRSTYRVTVRPTLAEVMNTYAKLRIINRLLDIQDRLAAGG